MVRGIGGLLGDMVKAAAEELGAQAVTGIVSLVQ